MEFDSGDEALYEAMAMQTRESGHEDDAGTDHDNEDGNVVNQAMRTKAAVNNDRACMTVQVFSLFFSFPPLPFLCTLHCTHGKPGVRTLSTGEGLLRPPREA